MVNRGSRETAGFPVSGPLHHGVTLRPLANRSCGQTLTANALYVVRYTAARPHRYSAFPKSSVASVSITSPPPPPPPESVDARSIRNSSAKTDWCLCSGDSGTVDRRQGTGVCQGNATSQIPQLALLGRLLWAYSTCSGVDRDHVWSGRVVGRAFAAVFVGIGGGSPPIMAVLRLEKAWRGLGNLTEFSPRRIRVLADILTTGAPYQP